jgi:mRNA-degrading endonuclease RelE of RelBE toxin-antitoxin system
VAIVERGWGAARLAARTGDYRVRFRVKGENVIVDKIGHRSDFYDEQD